MKYLDTDTGELIDFEWKTGFNHNTNAESERTGLECKDPSLAQQHQENESNINTIVKNFGITGQLPQVRLPPSIDEFTEVFDFQSAMNLLAAAKHSFLSLPAEVRSAFQNNPQIFVEQIDAMLGDADQTRRQDNMKVLRAMGLALEPGPIADKTTLGDVLKAIQAQTRPPEPPASGGNKEPAAGS